MISNMISGILFIATLTLLVMNYEIIDKSLNPAQRSVYHQQHLLPVLAEIKQWGDHKLQSDVGLKAYVKR